ncbi:MAG TPA: nitroreductase family protein [Aggregatilineales bacterium]|nr:nitroreductase family protein [Aggregatilineales bacterium]
MEKPAVNDHPIHDLLKNRWSPRSFSDRPVATEDLLSLFEAARWSPSGGNAQPWAFIVVTQADPEAHRNFVEILTGRNPLWAKDAPVLVLSIAKREYQPGTANPYAYYDLGQAVAHLTMQASTLGLSVHQMGGVDKLKARALFDIPEGYDPVTAIAIGYQGDLSALPEGLRERELEARTRKPLTDFVFGQRWNEPLVVDMAAS